MFLHEPGEENDSFTRQDLSMMNSIQTQQPNQTIANAAPPPHRGPPIAAAAAPMGRQDSSDAPSPTGDAPGLPATANWGSKAAQERRASRSTNASNPSPMVINAVPVQSAKAAKAEEAARKKEKEKEKEREKQEKEKAKAKEKEEKRRKEKEEEKEREKQEKEKEREREKEKAKSSQPSKASNPQPAAAPRPRKPCAPGFERLLKVLASSNLTFRFCNSGLASDDLKAIKEFPWLIEPNGGAKRRAAKEKKEQELAARRAAEEPAPSETAATAETEEHVEATLSGSQQLGGEPEERPEAGAQAGRHAIPLGQAPFGQNANVNADFADFGLGNRALTPQQHQQHQQLLLQNLKSAAPQSAGLQSNFGQPQNLQAGNPPGHTRNASRFSFGNDSASASVSVQPVVNQKLMNQQSSMMPKNTHSFPMTQQQHLGGQFYGSTVQGPPPGLKATGTPPVSGGGMFGQGHGFASSNLGYAAGRNTNDGAYQEMLRARNMEGARMGDAGKRESMFPTFLNQQHPQTSTPGPNPGILLPYGPSPGAYPEPGSQKSKKKGKKHRHANTSSSGGGGVVDVQDPSILQARIHQGGGMLGQGMYGGQGQGGFPPLYANNNYGGGAQRW